MNRQDALDLRVSVMQVRVSEHGGMECFNYGMGTWLPFCPMKELVTCMAVLDAAAGCQDAQGVEMPGLGVRDLINITVNAGRTYTRYHIYAISKEALQNAARS
jgi:hypothetical protein